MLIMGVGCNQQTKTNQDKITSTSDKQSTTTSETTTEKIEKISYNNDQYGFSLEFPSSWGGYVVKNRTIDWGIPGTSDSVDFGFSAQDSLFNISVISQDQWKKISSEEGPLPTYLGENNKYVFVYGAAQYIANNAMAARMGEIKDIIKTFKI